MLCLKISVKLPEKCYEDCEIWLKNPIITQNYPTLSDNYSIITQIYPKLSDNYPIITQNCSKLSYILNEKLNKIINILTFAKIILHNYRIF